MSKVGRPRKIETPEELINKWEEFKKYQHDHPIVKLVKFANDKGESTREEYFEQPLFIGDFTDYLNVGDNYLDQLTEEFSCVVSIIKRQINNQKLKGAMTGQYNASIVSQHLGMTNKSEVTSNVPIQVVFESIKK